MTKNQLLQTTFFKKLIEVFGAEVSSLTKDEVYHVISFYLDFLLKVYSFETFWNTLSKYFSVNELDSNEKKLLRAWLMNDGYHLKKVKYWLYMKTVGVDIRQLLKPEDRILDKILSEKSTKKILVVSNKQQILSVFDLDKVVLETVNSTKSFVLKYINRKMRFIINSDTLSVEDLFQELTFKGTQEIYRNYPELPSFEYVCNLYKRSIVDYGCNLLEKHSTKKHSRILKTENGFSGIVYSMNTTEAQLKELGMQDINCHADQITLRHDLIKFQSSLKEKYRLALDLLCGAPVQEFDDFIKERGYKLDSEALIIKSPKLHKKLVFDYTNVEESKRDKFIKYIENKLGDYNEVK